MKTAVEKTFMKSLSQKSSFKTLTDYTYMNQASLGLISNDSVNNMISFLVEFAQHGNSLISDLDEIELLTPVRQKLGLLFQCDPKNVAILSSASELLSQIPFIIPEPKCGKIIMVESDFPSLIRPWLAAIERGNKYNIKLIKDDPNTSLTKNIIKEIDIDTKAVVVSHVQFSTGTKLDYHLVSEATQKHDALFILDVTQSAGAIPLNFEEISADALISSGYKWLGGHGGAAFAILSDEFLRVDPLSTGWMSDPYPFEMNTRDLKFANSAMKFTQSTISYITIKGIEQSLDQILRLSTKKISNHSKKLSKILLNKIEATSWQAFRTERDYEFSSHIIALGNADQDIVKYYKKLTENRIITSMRNKRIRISIAHYNCEEDVKKLANILIS